LNRLGRLSPFESCIQTSALNKLSSNSSGGEAEGTTTTKEWKKDERLDKNKLKDAFRRNEVFLSDESYATCPRFMTNQATKGSLWVQTELMSGEGQYR
jgi:hypothetical protein